MIAEFLLLVLLGLAPSIVWLLFYLKEDPNPEPRRWLFFAFVSGVGAVPIALLVQQAILRLATPLSEAPVAALSAGIVFTLLGAALVEEAAKFLVVHTLLRRNPIFDEPVDAMIYMITAALGFAALENMFVLGTLGGSSLWTEGLPTITLRLIGANFLHTLASGIVGFSWALALVESGKIKKISRLGAGLAVATLLHGAFNLIILRFGALYLFPVTLLLFVVGLLVLHEFDILKRLQKPLNRT